MIGVEWNLGIQHTERAPFSQMAPNNRLPSARFLIPSASLAPGFRGPNSPVKTVQEQCGIPTACLQENGPLNIVKAESIVAQHGRRLPPLEVNQAAFIVIDRDPAPQALSCPWF
jgi:hypothetical protein